MRFKFPSYVFYMREGGILKCDAGLFLRKECGGGSKVKIVGETKFDDDSIITFVLRSLLYYTHTQSYNIPQKKDNEL